MKTARPSLRPTALLPKIRPLLVMAFLGGLAGAPLLAKPNKVELPLVLESEFREAMTPRLGQRVLVQVRPLHLSQNCAYELVVVFGFLEKLDPELNFATKDYEPVGLHLDPDPDNVSPEIAGGKPLPPGENKKVSISYRVRTPDESLRFEFEKEEKAEKQASSTIYADREIPARINHDGNETKTVGASNRVPLHWMAESLAIYSRKNVLMSARLEKRWCPDFRLDGSPAKNVDDLEKLLAKEGVRPVLIGDDAYVLLEVPGRERTFPYTSRPRAEKYETEREAWLAKNEDYVPQGLIYQPTKQSPVAIPKREVRMRHAAAALAKLTGKEVFVQPLIEKREFDFPRSTGRQTTRDSAEDFAALARQLDKSSVRILELNPRALALVAD